MATDFTTLSHLQLAKQLRDTSVAVQQIQHRARQAMAGFQQQQQALMQTQLAIQAEMDKRIAEEDGSPLPDVKETVSATRMAQQLKNDAERHKQLFPPATGDGRPPDQETNPPKVTEPNNKE